jgi:murein DD-endopeptidase MepM/ murein hydrolase activator NlpD
VGECGNSGNSGEPHLHYQLQNRPDLITADGLPPTFVNYTSNGKGPTRGTPETGERVSNNRMNAAGQAWKAD